VLAHEVEEQVERPLELGKDERHVEAVGVAGEWTQAEGGGGLLLGAPHLVERRIARHRDGRRGVHCHARCRLAAFCLACHGSLPSSEARPYNTVGAGPRRGKIPAGGRM